MLFDEVRRTLLAEALLSPGLLSDLAGLEHYVAESYDARSFIELLQNADDAQATRFTVRLCDGYLLVANDGRLFTQADFESLCRSAASTKTRGSTIGYRGIGFKSVVHFSTEVYVFSGDLEAVFSRERTAREIPDATRSPLIRIPHAIATSEVSLFREELQQIWDDDYKTAFVFTGVDYSVIKTEFDSFDATSMLFLNNILQVDISGENQVTLTASKIPCGDHRSKVRLDTGDGTREWLIVDGTGISLAFGYEDGHVQPLQREDAVVHAFLPTLEATGCGAKINGDFSTDPSRTRVVMDGTTRNLIRETARLYVDIVRDASLSGDPQRVEEAIALIPNVDPRLAKLQRSSFRVELLREIQECADAEFGAVRLRPSWLNSKDHLRAVSAVGCVSIPVRLEEIPGAVALLKDLGAIELQVEEVLLSVESVAPSLVGAAEILAAVSARNDTKQIALSPAIAELQLWKVGSELVSLRHLERSREGIDLDFLALVSERGSTRDSLHRLISSSIGRDIATRLLSSEQTNGDEAEQPVDAGSTAQATSLSGKSRWRGAELQLLELLNSQGWRVTDVSRRNEGYDLEGFRPDGEPAFIEVKAVDSFRSPFVMTNNELLVSRQLGSQYVVVLVRASQLGIEVALIEDPGSRLDLNRQCRQWVWECESFEVAPVFYRFSD